MAYNLLAVVLAALRRVHGEERVDEEVSLYYIANEITTTYHGMRIAIPEPEVGRVLFHEHGRFSCHLG